MTEVLPFGQPESLPIPILQRPRIYPTAHQTDHFIPGMSCSACVRNWPWTVCARGRARRQHAADMPLEVRRVGASARPREEASLPQNILQACCAWLWSLTPPSLAMRALTLIRLAWLTFLVLAQIAMNTLQAEPNTVEYPVSSRTRHFLLLYGYIPEGGVICLWCLAVIPSSVYMLNLLSLDDLLSFHPTLLNLSRAL